MPPQRKRVLPYLPPGLSYLGGTSSRLPFIEFRPVVSVSRESTRQKPPAPRGGKSNHVAGCTCAACRKIARAVALQPTRLYYKSSLALVSATLEANGFDKTTKDNWLVFWCCGGLKAYVFQGLNRYQRVNQFPRTHEITRKDQLCRNITRMQQLHGTKHFDFLPPSFVLPSELDAFRQEAARCPGVSWIVKPAASACGRGIFVTDSVDEVPRGGTDGNCLVSRYIDNPLLLDGKKFDIRIYVGVTSFHPLKIYLYREGLVRLATEPYSTDSSSLANRFVHLTNYSVQKKSTKYQRAGEREEKGCSDAGGNESDESSHKWTLAMLRRRLRKMGLDDNAMWEEMSMVIAKALIAIEPQVVAAMDMYVKHPSSCFQLFGFDVLFDDALKPWLIEVNLGPSLSCDSPLDLAVKSAMIADLLTLAGVQPYDAVRMKACAAQGVTLDLSTGNADPSAEESSASRQPVSPTRKREAKDAGARWTTGSSAEDSSSSVAIAKAAEERRALRELEEEAQRCGGWDRIFPTPGACNALAMRAFFEERRALNEVLAKHVANTAKGSPRSSTTAASSVRHSTTTPSARRSGGAKPSASARNNRQNRLQHDTDKHRRRQQEALESRRAANAQLRRLMGRS